MRRRCKIVAACLLCLAVFLGGVLGFFFFATTGLACDAVPFEARMACMGFVVPCCFLVVAAGFYGLLVSVSLLRSDLDFRPPEGGNAS